MTTDEFRVLIWQKGSELYRDMPWRRDTRAYYVLVSELMLQQTQVSRVIPKFEAFIAAFPTERALAHASLADVLRLWQGLGYNRRAKYLHEAAKMVVYDLDGQWPATTKGLMQLPGVGPNTAGAMMAYVYNVHTIFIETNIRTVYFLHFFKNTDKITDFEVRKMLEATIDHDEPRKFYWALMDYGSWLKANGVRNVSASKHYKKQAPLAGSIRQVRGQIVAALTAKDMSESQLKQHIDADERFAAALDGLLRDGLIMRQKGRLHLTK